MEVLSLRFLAYTLLLVLLLAGVGSYVLLLLRKRWDPPPSQRNVAVTSFRLNRHSAFPGDFFGETTSLDAIDGWRDSPASRNLTVLTNQKLLSVVRQANLTLLCVDAHILVREYIQNFRAVGVHIHLEMQGGYGCDLFPAACASNAILRKYFFAPWWRFPRFQPAAQAAYTVAQNMRERRAFYEEFRPYAPQFDGFLCTFPGHVCTFFMPFRKPILIIETNRMHHHGKANRALWQAYLSDLTLLRRQSAANAYAASSVYDSCYSTYYAGFAVPVVPSMCLHVRAPVFELLSCEDRQRVEWTGKRWVKSAQVFLGPHRLPYGSEPVVAEINQTLTKAGFTVLQAKQASATHSIDDLQNFCAVVVLYYVPYSYSFDEYLHAQIPIFCPSIAFMLEHASFLHDLTMDATDSLAPPPATNTTAADAAAAASWRAHSPLSLRREDLAAWLPLAQCYQLPPGVVTTFDSAEDLARKLLRAPLRDIRAKMGVYIRRRRVAAYRGYLHLAYRVAEFKLKQQQQRRQQRSQGGVGGKGLGDDVSFARLSFEQAMGVAFPNWRDPSTPNTTTTTTQL